MSKKYLWYCPHETTVEGATEEGLLSLLFLAVGKFSLSNSFSLFCRLWKRYFYLILFSVCFVLIL